MPLYKAWDAKQERRKAVAEEVGTFLKQELGRVV